MTNTDFITARYHANEAADSLLVAYWMECGGGNYEYHHRRAMESFEKLASLLGYTVDKVTEPVALFGMKPAAPEAMTAEACNV